MRLKEVASIDLQNAHNNVVAKDREIGRLKGLLTVQENKAPEFREVRTLLELWRDEIRGKTKGPKPSIAADSKRAVRVRWALKNYGAERTRAAILGCQFDDWAMGRLKKTQGRTFNDLAKHILKDEETFERFEALHRSSQKPAEQTPSPSVPVLTLVEALPYSPLEVVYDRANRLGLDPQGEVWRFRARCPAHEDSERSLLVIEDCDRRATLFCPTCSPEEIVKALGVPWGALFPEGHRHHSLVGLRKAA